MPPARNFLFQVRDVNRRLRDGISLESSARRAGQSRFKFHRMFHRTTGETLKQYTLRLRLERSAARLIATDDTILAIALNQGFASHEVFTRAFNRYFGTSPTKYRISGRLHIPKPQRPRHLAFTEAIGPCLRLFHHRLEQKKRRTTVTTLSITRKEIAPQHILFIRRRIPHSALTETLGECFGTLFPHGAKAGLPIAGWPLCRYVSTSPGLWTIDPAMPLAAPAKGEGEMRPDVLPGGPVALGIHAGPYEDLPDTNAAVQKWIEENGFEVSGPPWECYVTDPGEHPNPADWRTEVYWPLAK